MTSWILAGEDKSIPFDFLVVVVVVVVSRCVAEGMYRDVEKSDDEDGEVIKEEVEGSSSLDNEVVEPLLLLAGLATSSSLLDTEESSVSRA